MVSESWITLGVRVAKCASDAEPQWSLVAPLAAGNGVLSDLDARREDVGRRLPGLREVPWSRRLGEFLARLEKWHCG